MATTKKKAKQTAPVLAAAQPVELLENPDGKAAFDRWLPEAQRPDAAVLVPFRADATLAFQNLQSGVRAVLAQEAKIKDELKTVDIKALRALPELALAVTYAQACTARFVADPSQIPTLLNEGLPLREQLLAHAESLAHFNLIPAAKVKKVRAGKGFIDAAQDLVDLADLYEANAAALRGRSPVGKQETQRAREIGSRLLTLLKPKGTKTGKGSELAEAIAARDLLWSLLVARHAMLWRVGAWLFGRDVDEHVPALQSRRQSPSTASKKMVPPLTSPG